MNTSLYILTGDYLALSNKLNDSELDEQTIIDTLDGASGEIEVKAKNVAMFIRNLESSAEQIKLAEKAMSERRKSLENKAESIKRYLKENMTRCGLTKIECEYFALTIKKNPPSVVIDDDKAIPNEFMVTPEPVAPYPDKSAIKAAIQAGAEVAGAHIEQGERLEIK
jgi:hypothetical protein